MSGRSRGLFPVTTPTVADGLRAGARFLFSALPVLEILQREVVRLPEMMKVMINDLEAPPK